MGNSFIEALHGVVDGYWLAMPACDSGVIDMRVRFSYDTHVRVCGYYCGLLKPSFFW